MKGIIGKKLGMTSIFRQDGKNVPVTIIEAGPCAVTQIKTVDTDGYNAVQLAYGNRKPSNTPQPLAKHFEKAGVAPKQHVKEFRNFDIQAELGEEIGVTIFAEGEKVSVVGNSKGKGFQGVVKRHGFSGVGMATHGQHNRLRAPGSVGSSSWCVVPFQATPVPLFTLRNKLPGIKLTDNESGYSKYSRKQDR